MKEKELKKLVDKLKACSAETEWLEFKVNYYTPQEKYIIKVRTENLCGY